MLNRVQKPLAVPRADDMQSHRDAAIALYLFKVTYIVRFSHA